MSRVSRDYVHLIGQSGGRTVGQSAIGQSESRTVGPSVSVGTPLVCTNPRGCNIWSRAEDWSWYVKGRALPGALLVVTAPWVLPAPMIYVREGLVFASDVRPIRRDPRVAPPSRIPARLPSIDPRTPVSERTTQRSEGLFLPTEILR